MFLLSQSLDYAQVTVARRSEVLDRVGRFTAIVGLDEMIQATEDPAMKNTQFFAQSTLQASLSSCPDRY
jgi:hypothetical protein